MRLQLRRSLRVVAALVACGLALLSAVDVARAQAAPPTPVADEDDGRPVPMLYGPIEITLLDQGALRLPPGYRFQATRPKRSAQANADPSAPHLLGTVLSLGDAPKWLMFVSFQKVGYTPPAVLAAMTEAEILDSLKNAATNGRSRGAEPLQVKSLFEPPAHDPAAQRMRVVTRVAGSGPIDADGDIIDATTFLFGRHGVLTLKFLAGERDFAARRPTVDAVLAGLTFMAGKRGADAVAGQDPVVQYPLQLIFGGETISSIKAKAAEAAEAAAAVRAEAAAAAAQKALEDRQRAEADEASAARTSAILLGLAAACLLVIGFFVVKLIAVALQRRAKPASDNTAPRASATIRRAASIQATAAG